MDIYSYEDIANNYYIVSTVGDFTDGIIVGYKDGYYYTFRRSYPVELYSLLNFEGKAEYSKAIRNHNEYKLIKTSRNYVSQYRIQ